MSPVAQAGAAPATDADVDAIQRPAAEVLYTEELRRLEAADAGRPRPAGWRLAPRSVLAFILGDQAQGVSPKFVGSRSLLERCVVALATNRGLMLIGEPGTAKSYLSELLAAAISGDSTLIIQGSAGTTEDAIKYSWNYALLLAEGPTERALVPAPLHRGLSEGKLVRFEEITRCPLEIQDTLLSVLSERVLAIPERQDEGRTLYARTGFNVIATANTRDRGVNEMSAALKRRFNFVTIPVIADVEQEAAIVERRSHELLGELGVAAEAPRDLVTLLTTVFAELRRGQTLDGTAKVKSPSTVLSTAELISVVANGALLGSFFGNGRATLPDLCASLVGAVAKENSADLAVLQEYLETIVKGRPDRPWRDFYAAGRAALKNE